MIKNIYTRSTLLLLVVFSLLSLPSYGFRKKKKADKETVQWRYEVEAAGTGVQGTYQIKVWTYSRYPETAVEQAKKNAVHAVIFKGFPSKGRIEGQKPLSRNPNLEQDKKSFFKEFFKDGGKFQKYVFLANNGAIAPGDRIKLSKKEYKIGVVVSVHIAGLRKDLEAAGIIKGLSSGF